MTQCTTQQQYTKPRHQPSDRDQRASDRLRNKVSAFQAKIKSPAYITLGAAALQTVHQTFDPDLPVTFYLLMLTTKPPTNTIPTLFVIQGYRHCMPTSDYYFMNIQPDPKGIPPHSENILAQHHNKQQPRIKFHNKQIHGGQVKPEFILPC